MLFSVSHILVTFLSSEEKCYERHQAQKVHKFCNSSHAMMNHDQMTDTARSITLRHRRYVFVDRVKGFKWNIFRLDQNAQCFRGKRNSNSQTRINYHYSPNHRVRIVKSIAFQTVYFIKDSAISLIIESFHSNQLRKIDIITTFRSKCD